MLDVLTAENQQLRSNGDLLLKLSTADERENAIFEYDLPSDNYPSSFRHMLTVRENDENMAYWENSIFDRHDSVRDIYAVIYSIGIDNYNINTALN